MNRCPSCGSLRVMLAIDGAHGFCTRCRRRLAIDDHMRPMFARVAALADHGSGPPDPHPAA